MTHAFLIYTCKEGKRYLCEGGVYKSVADAQRHVEAPSYSVTTSLEGVDTSDLDVLSSLYGWQLAVLKAEGCDVKDYGVSAPWDAETEALLYPTVSPYDADDFTPFDRSGNEMDYDDIQPDAEERGGEIIAKSDKYLVEFEDNYLSIARYEDGHAFMFRGKGALQQFRDCLKTHDVNRVVEVFAKMRGGAVWSPIYKPERMPR